MAQTDEIADLVIKLKADVKDLTTSMGQAKKIVEEKNAEMKNSFTSLGTKLAAVFAASKIKDWALASIKAYGESQRAIERLSNATKAAGLNWDKLGKSVKNYIDRAEEMTRFNDGEVSDSLAGLVGQTKDMSVALNLNSKAMDLAVGLNISLAEASNMLALAYAGNDRGLAQLARAMRLTGKDSKDVAKIFGEVDKRFGGLAEKEQNLGTETVKMGAAWENFGKGMAQTFEPVIRLSIDLVKKLLIGATEATRVIRELFGMVDAQSDKKAVESAIKGEEKYIERIKARIEAQKENMKYVKVYSDAEKESFLKGDKDLLAAAEKHLIETRKLLTAGTEDVKKASNAKVKANAQANAQIIKDDEAAVEKKKKHDEMLMDMAKNLGSVIAETSKEAASEMTRAYQEGTLTVGKSLEIMAKAVFKATVKGIGEGLIQRGVAYMAEATAALLSVVGAPAAPGRIPDGRRRRHGGGG